MISRARDHIFAIRGNLAEANPGKVHACIAHNDASETDTFNNKDSSRTGQEGRGRVGRGEGAMPKTSGAEKGFRNGPESRRKESRDGVDE